MKSPFGGLPGASFQWLVLGCILQFGGRAVYGFQNIPIKKIKDAALSNEFLLRSALNTASASKPSADDKLHILFSTGCNAFQHWQGEVLLNTALRVGQRGKFTHLVAGCEEREDVGGVLDKSGSKYQRHTTHQGGDADRLVTEDVWKKSTMPNVHVHIVPMIKEAKEFPWMNKPWSYHHFALHGNWSEDETIVILDPDEFFLQPLTQKGTPPSELLCHQKSCPPSVSDIAKPGMGVAQKFGFGVSGTAVTAANANANVNAKAGGVPWHSHPSSLL